MSAAKKSDTVKVTGLGFPNDMKPFVADGTSPVFGLWSVPDLGYLAEQVAAKLVSGEIKGTEGEPFTVRASTATSRTPSARTAPSSSARPSGSTRRTSTTSTSRSARPRPTGADRAPEATLPGLHLIRRSDHGTCRVHHAPAAGPGGRVPPAARGGLAGDARRAAGRGGT